jgi:iron-sulfur cluster assembly accessory protein
LAGQGLHKTEHDRLIGMNVETDLKSPTVTLTERAAKRIVEILREDPAHAMLRVAVTGGGCSGFQYDFCLDDSRGEDDLVIARDGAMVLIDPVSLGFLNGAEIDFADEMIGAAFKIKNPNATSSCGCGTSFSV